MAARYFFRPTSIFITPLFLRLGLSANTVTLINAMLLVVSLIALAWGSTVGYWLGGLLLLSASIVDYADGNVARFYGSASLFGKLIDSLVDSMSHLHFAALGIGLALETNEGRVITALTWVGIGLSFLVMFQFIVDLRILTLKLEQRLLGPDMTNAEGPSKRRSGLTDWVSWLYLNWYFAQPLILCAAILAGDAGIYLILSAIVHGIFVPPRIARAVFGNRSLERARDPRSAPSTQ